MFSFDLFISISLLVKTVWAQDFLRIETNFAGIHFEKLTFFDNTSLFDDVTYVDRLVTEIETRQVIATNPDPTLMSITESSRVVSTDDFTVEVLLIADYSMYEKFREFYPEQEAVAYTALRNYLTQIYNQIQSIYSRFVFFEHSRLSLQLVDVMPIIRYEDCPLSRSPLQYNETFDVEEAFTSNTTMKTNQGIEALSALHAIHVWLDENSNLIPKRDYTIVITRRDLLSQLNESSTQGMAYVRAMCRGPDSASIVEDVGGFATAAIAAHEMGHSLGAFHDGLGNNTQCSGRFNFLMSPTTSGNEQNDRFDNSVRLSNCSIEQIEEFLGSDDANCLREPLFIELKRVPKWSSLDFRMDNTFDRTQQCRLAFGSSYGVCTQKNPATRRKTVDPCRRLWCKNRAEHRFNSCETKSYLPLMDGTECGNGKRCLSGTCQLNRTSGNNKRCEDVRVSYCRKFASEQNRRLCVVKYIREICCKTCKSVDIADQPTGTPFKLKSKHIKNDL
ncbi:ADAM family mig-17 [Aphelenchoides besseyi]|nr:ADAM family mig-17 [Aphelenchoides besseyi]